MKRLLPVLILVLVLSTACAGDPLKAGGITATRTDTTPTTTVPYTAPYRVAAAPTTTTTGYAYPNGWSDETAINFLEAFEKNYRASAGRAPEATWANCAGAAVMLRWSPAEADRLAANGQAQVVIDEIIEQCGRPT